jgi:hypothetical protein
MSHYKILLTADRKQRAAALELMKVKSGWPVGREPKLADIVVEDGEGLYLVGSDCGFGLSKDTDPDLAQHKDISGEVKIAPCLLAAPSGATHYAPSEGVFYPCFYKDDFSMVWVCDGESEQWHPNHKGLVKGRTVVAFDMFKDGE